MTVKVDGVKLKIRDVVRVARPGANGRFEKAVLHPDARERIAATRAYIDRTGCATTRPSCTPSTRASACSRISGC
jgi:hypothetical protein